MRRPRHILAGCLAIGLTVHPSQTAAAQAFEWDARSGGLADATTALGDVRVGGESRGSVSLSGSQSYGLPELRVGRIRMAQSIPEVALAVVVDGDTFGDELFRASSLRAGMTRVFRAVGPRSLRVGASVRYAHVGIRGYGSANAVGISIRTLVDLTPELVIGFQALNVNAPAGEAGRHLPRVLAVGIGYQPDERARLFLDVAKDLLHAATVRSGIELELVAPLELRCGFATKPTRVAIGFGVSVASISIDMAIQRHGDLGWSQIGSLGIAW